MWTATSSKNSLSPTKEKLVRAGRIEADVRARVRWIRIKPKPKS